MKTLIFISAALLPTCAWGDFSGSDSLESATDQWSYLHSGGGSFVPQNSRLEFIVTSPASMNEATLFWEANQGAYDRSWYLQVDTNLALPPLAEGDSLSLSLFAGNLSDHSGKQSAGIYSGRAKADGLYYPNIAGYTDLGFFGQTKCTTRAVRLRLHFDSKEKTITGSWNAGKGWKYLVPQSIKRWGMGNSDKFYALLNASNTGPTIDNLLVASGNACFTNFEAGAAKPEIAIEQPFKTNLVSGKRKLDFGSVSVGIGRVKKTFTIRNNGTADLKGFKITNNGANPADFIVIAPTASIVRPGATTTFTVVFKPRAIGVRNTSVHISSNDAGAPSFGIKLSGLGGK
ncbi:MAG: choice-of-anchor D domain-containing protein [Luteolibacter sp.]